MAAKGPIAPKGPAEARWTVGRWVSDVKGFGRRAPDMLERRSTVRGSHSDTYTLGQRRVSGTGAGKATSCGDELERRAAAASLVSIGVVEMTRSIATGRLTRRRPQNETLTQAEPSTTSPDRPNPAASLLLLEALPETCQMIKHGRPCWKPRGS